MLFIKKFFNNISFPKYNYIFLYANKVKLCCDVRLQWIYKMRYWRHDIGIFEQFFFGSYIR